MKQPKVVHPHMLESDPYDTRPESDCNSID